MDNGELKIKNAAEINYPLSILNYQLRKFSINEMDKKTIWKTIIQTLVTILTAIGTTLGVTSCMM